MAKQAAVQEAKPSIVARVVEFYQDVMVEMQKVTWPSLDELKGSTQVVLFMLVVVAAIIYAYDWLFQVIVLGLLRIL